MLGSIKTSRSPFLPNTYPVIVAQCTFEDSRSATASPLSQESALAILFKGDCRFDNSTLSNNEGKITGAIDITLQSSTYKNVLTDVLFRDNLCTSATTSKCVADCMFYYNPGISTNQFFDCFSTSEQPHCGVYQATQVFPELVGPSITSVVQTIQENEKRDGLEVVLSFEGVFTETSRKYDVTLKDSDGTEFVAEKVSFSKTAGTAKFAISNPSIPCISSSTSYSIIDVKKSPSQSTSNEFAVGEVEEPDWTWWHHTNESRADNMVGLSFTTPPGPTLTEIEAELNGSNLDEAVVTITVSPCAAHGHRYEITQCDITSQDTVLDGRVFFHVPAPPTLTGVDFSFATKSNTTFHLILEGTNLPVGETFVVSLEGFDPEIEVTFSSTNQGSSTELALGWSDTLQFDTAYPLRSVINKNRPTIEIPSTHLTLQTKPCLNPLILYATDSGNMNARFCGDVDRPCSSVEVAKTVVDGITAQIATIRLISKASLSTHITVDAGHELKLELVTLTPPTLVIPSTASLGSSDGLVSVDGTLLVEKVNIDVQIDDLAFVLFDVKKGKLLLDSVHISGNSSSVIVAEGLEGLCAWETGLIKLHDSSAELANCRISSIAMGEIWMESSNLTLTSTQILSNGAQFSLFPSAQQDMMCKSGEIVILPNSSDTTTDHWISSTSECSVFLNRHELKSPHFVPSLDVKSCRSTLSKKKDSFSVSIVGSKLIPCDLRLEMSESPSSSSQSSKSNTDPILLPLSFSSVESWNETHITLSIALSSLSKLSLDDEWTACIVFGMNEHTDSFAFLPSLKDRKSHAFQKSLPWLIPVIVCSVLLLLAILVFVVVTCRRKKQAASSKTEKTFTEQELAEDVVVKMEVEGTMVHSTENVIGEKSDEDGRFGLIQHNHSPTIELMNSTAKEERKIGTQVEAMKCQDDFGIVLVNNADTLYNRLHKEHAELGSKENVIERQIVMGLQRIADQNRLVNVGCCYA
ncbi:hypothetical protein BLNAU_18921 [Blattamonas nauphoetae]|uniref:Uncharacterized protein n=1 Tax=Blattamonas nauphoetae TaxID=2049346 RepID=A0ABQ9X3C0_9EUKA|nr:hypothetical protein BLNAU_18921 [Blattamonas nauphoetae]